MSSSPIDYLKKLITKEFDYSEDEIREFNTFIVQRYLSMYGDYYAYATNTYLNSCPDLFMEKEICLKLLDSFIQKQPRLSRFKYISKPKKKESPKTKEEENEKIARLARSLELPKRQIKELMELDHSFQNKT